MPSTTLFCTEGGSNKEYHVELIEGPDGFRVNTRHGPRGRATALGTKTPAPVDQARAQRIYDKLIADKIAKGYTPDISGQAYVGTELAGRKSSWRPALLTPVDADGVQALLDAGDWIATEKIDGERRAVEVTIDGGRGINRRGLYVATPSSWEQALGELPPDTILDGEFRDERLFVFDCPRLGGNDLSGHGYRQRLHLISQHLERIDHAGSGPVVALRPAVSPEAKHALLRRVTDAGGEGIVLRRADGAYEPGVTPGSVKFKLHESATCIVSRHNEGRRSVGLALLDRAGAEVDVGNVTVPSNHALPAEGSLVEVRYMHMFAGGSLYQPVYLGPRVDLERRDAALAQVTRVVGAETQDHAPSTSGTYLREPALDLEHERAPCDRPRG